VVRAAPDAEIVATDLNQAMLDVAAARVRSPAVTFQQADAMSLPFGDGAFDLVVCQFGAMFFPDRPGAYREARRVLKRGGLFLFNVWDSLEKNPASAAAARAVADMFPENAPSFLARVPFGYHDTARIEQELRRAGFEEVVAETVAATSRGSADDAATGLVFGSPLRLEIEERDAARLDEARDAAAAALRSLAGEDGVLDNPMSAHVISARA
jgi:ubiquinone/menaquinone biosynthesis C-methylase UbiE